MKEKKIKSMLLEFLRMVKLLVIKKLFLQNRMRLIEISSSYDSKNLYRNIKEEVKEIQGFKLYLHYLLVNMIFIL